MGQNKNLIWANIHKLWEEVEALKLRQPTTAEPTQTVLTTEGPSDADLSSYKEYGLQDVTTLSTQPSSQSDPVDTGSGLVELHSVCANVHRRMFYLNEAEDNPYRALFAWEWCPISAEPVLKSSVRIPAQGAEATSSISVKQHSKESVGNSVEESVESLSKRWTIEEHKNWDQTTQLGLTDGTYHILLPKEETHNMAKQHAKYLTERHY